jgi:hypothetical protein
MVIWVRKMVENGMKNGNFKFSSFGTSGTGRSYSYSSNSHQNSPFENIQKNPEVDTDENIVEAEYTIKK